MLSRSASCVPHFGQRDRGRTTDSRFGTRSITTLRNEPTTRPSTPQIAASTPDITTEPIDAFRRSVSPDATEGRPLGRPSFSSPLVSGELPLGVAAVGRNLDVG